MNRETGERGRPARQMTPTKRPNSSADSRVSAKFNRLDIGSLVNDNGSQAGEPAGGPVVPPPGVPRTAAMRHLSDKQVRRRWARKPDGVDMSRPHVIEAAMIYERGESRGRAHVCNRCKRGDMVFDGCICIAEMPGVCSNCLYDQEPCERADTGEDSPVLGDDSAFWELTNELADRSFVLALVAQIRRRAGYGEQDSPVERAKEIEEAAMKVARLTREWRLARERKGDPATDTAKS
ncbi:hypothetical protein NKR23_g8120 [Pleurostoma richardsiae]|uniref:Uncharacterized protein n=1 Tax=Pleurostoma richardsiae TaxID=41990 RepID=A0AA38R709_9PEZI|nr:hypothetical protein NKR23_g8120 [Pleurostoma richardsiae]